MSAEDPLDDLAGSVLDGIPVDWDLAASTSTGPRQEANIRALRDLERIVSYSRSLQRHPESPDVTLPEQWGHLTLLELTSAGKSGEIWRAWDAWLRREVALKFLFTLSAGDADDSALLEEARALARVRHPGVVAVYGIGAHAGRIGMWMELLVGNTLEAEIELRGPLPTREVAQVGLDLCRALEAVEGAGLVHRDIKPTNIVRESSGRIVLTDFGLGKRRALAEREAWRSSGTPLFMSPELLGGERATARSDLYALGVTLRWALTGHCPFRARRLQELRAEARVGPATPLRAERPDAPVALVEAIDQAMAPRAEARFAGAGQLAHRLKQVLDNASATDHTRARWRRIAAAAIATGLVGVTTMVLVNLRGRSPSSHGARFSVAAPPNAAFNPSGPDQSVSPDGRLLAFVALDSAGVQRLWLRPLESLTVRPIEGTEDVYGFPFWSPDSRHLGFFAQQKLKKISVSGGPPEVLCRAPDPRGGTWGKDGVIVFAPDVAGPLWRISAEGGQVTEIQRPDSTRHETALRWPQFLPDGKHFLFVALPPREGNFDVFVATPDSKDRRLVMNAGCAPICAGDKGVVLASNGRLMLQKFDYRGLRPIGAPLSLGIAPFADVSVGQPLASASMNGVLAHSSETPTNTRFTWLDRSGNRIGALQVPEGRYESMSFAPDGKRFLAERRDSPSTMDLWMVDLDQGEARRFSQGSQSRLGGKPVWSPDGRHIAFNSNRSGRTYIYKRPVNQPREEELLYQSQGQFTEVLCWSPDGRYLVFEQAGLGTGWDLWLLPLDGKREAVPYLKTRFNEYAAAISPDGRWLAYTTDASGKAEIYVRSFPKPGAEHLASNLAAQPLWCKGGRELVFGDGKGMWSVPVSTTPTFKAGTPRFLFRRNLEARWVMPTPAGDRFLEIRPDDKADPVTITVDTDVLTRIGL